jgi:NAD(P)H dehydrogenase (quinone)
MGTCILVINGHPRADSLCDALANAYVEGARAAGHTVTTLNLRALTFDPVLRAGYAEPQPLETDLVAAQEAIRAAGHIVIAFPIWWASTPALLKGFFDRVLLPGFAFKYREGSPLWDKYLTGRTARLLVTSDSPGWYLALVTHNPAVRSVKAGVLEFCGIAPVRTTGFGGVRLSDDAKRQKWLAEARALGERGA